MRRPLANEVNVVDNMKRLTFFHFLIFTFFLASCTGDKQVQMLLEQAEGYLPVYPDSADMMLCRVDSIWGTDGSDSRESDAYYKLIRTMTNAIWLSPLILRSQMAFVIVRISL